MNDKRKVVKELFENTDLYLTYDYNLRIRRETVAAFVSGMTFRSVIDIPSGTGAISIPLLPKTEKLTLIDISSNMLEIARKNIPSNEITKAELINKDFFETELRSGSYDLVICLGLLAHVNSPAQLLSSITDLVKPGGYLIIQNTNASHFYSYLIRFYLGIKNLVSKQPYILNKIKASYMEKFLSEKNFSLLKSYRYNQSFLGFSNLFSNERKYGLTRKFFGDANHPRNQYMGSDYTYLFRKN